MSSKVKVAPSLRFLGLKVKDKITGFSGVVTTVGFDLYGCVQVLVNPGLDAEEKPKELMWFDINRLSIIQSGPVMDVPEFDFADALGLALEGKELHAKGPENKPTKMA
jgi:hypothetical protein